MDNKVTLVPTLFHAEVYYEMTKMWLFYIKQYIEQTHHIDNFKITNYRITPSFITIHWKAINSDLEMCDDIMTEEFIEFYNKTK